MSMSLLRCVSVHVLSSIPHNCLMQVTTLFSDTQDTGGDLKSGQADTRTENIQKCIHSLVHACSCRDTTCRRMSCHKMKRVVMHAKQCRRRHDAQCAVCKQLIALCCYHAKSCNEPDCEVPFCNNIRQKLREQTQARRRQADYMMRRRMGALQQGNNGMRFRCGENSN